MQLADVQINCGQTWPGVSCSARHTTAANHMYHVALSKSVKQTCGHCESLLRVKHLQVLTSQQGLKCHWVVRADGQVYASGVDNLCFLSNHICCFESDVASKLLLGLLGAPKEQFSM